MGILVEIKGTIIKIYGQKIPKIHLLYYLGLIINSQGVGIQSVTLLKPE